jgi:hypothetical protein
MRLLTIFLLLFAISLQADPSIKSDVVVEKESYTLVHESTYGVTNSYSLLIIEHHIESDNALLFHYGTCVGLIFEEHTAQNGFGPTADEYGLMIEANLGVDYKLKNHQTLSLKGTRSQNQLLDAMESRVQFKYFYQF